MTEAPPPGPTRTASHTWPGTSGAAVRDNALYAAKLAQRAAEIRAHPEAHKPKLVLSRHVRGESPLDRIADAVNKFCGSMWVFLGITVGIVVWLFAGNIVGFDKTPWPLLLTHLEPAAAVHHDLAAGERQPGADRQRQARDRRPRDPHRPARDGQAATGHLHGQDQVLAILNNFASHDMPGRQRQIMADVKQILAKVDALPAAG